MIIETHIITPEVYSTSPPLDVVTECMCCGKEIFVDSFLFENHELNKCVDCEVKPLQF